MIQQAIAQVLTCIFDPEFSEQVTGSGQEELRVHAKPVKKFKDKVKQILFRSNGRSTDQRVKVLNSCIIGWIDYFGLADMKNLARGLVEWSRRRLRMCIWKQWRKIKTRG